MSIELMTSTIVCARCGTGYKARQSNFSPCHCSIYKGIGYLTVCKKCVEAMFQQYLVVSMDAKRAVRQICRKLDLYWSDDAFEQVFKRNAQNSLITAYISKINTGKFVGKSYDDTLNSDGTMWDFTDSEERKLRTVEDTAKRVAAADFFGSQAANNADSSSNQKIDVEIPDEVIAFWGPSYTPDMYAELEQRRSFWMSRFPEGVELEVGTEALIRQICSLEIDINRGRAEGKQVDKLVIALKNVIESAQLNPTQKSADAKGANANTPFGVWIKRWEDERPIPEVDPSLKDVDGIKKYIMTWFHGHLAKMLGLKKAEVKLYDDEISKLRVERPEYDEEDDEAMLNDFFSEFSSGEADEQQ